MHGQGTMYGKNGKVAYKGQFKDGKMHGQGAMYLNNGKKFNEGQYRYGKHLR